VQGRACLRPAVFRFLSANRSPVAILHCVPLCVMTTQQDLMVTLRIFSPAMPFNLRCWGFTFPLGVQSLGTLALARTTRLGLFSVVGSILVVWLAALWPIVAVLIIVAVGDTISYHAGRAGLTEGFRDDWSGTGPLPKPDMWKYWFAPCLRGAVALQGSTIAFSKGRVNRVARHDVRNRTHVLLKTTTCLKSLVERAS
jgi:hypothetical protein